MDVQTFKLLEEVQISLESLGFTVNLVQPTGISAMYEQRAYDILLKGYSSLLGSEWFVEYHSTLFPNIHALLGTTAFDSKYEALLSSTSAANFETAYKDLQALDMETMYRLPLLRTSDSTFVNNERLSVPSDMVFGNIRYRSDLRVDEWEIKKEEVVLAKTEIPPVEGTQ